MYPNERTRSRARARGRVEPTHQHGESSSPPTLSNQPSPNSRGTPPEEIIARAEVYSHMFEDPPRRLSDGSSGSTGNGSNGNGSNGNGSSNGNGRSNGSNGGSSRGRGSPPVVSGAGDLLFLPRGTAARAGAADFVFPTDYVQSRPDPNFVKKAEPGPNQKWATVATNYYTMKTHPQWKMSLYAVKFEPEVNEQFMMRKLVASHREQIGSYMLTGNQLFTTKMVPPENLVYNTTWEIRETGDVVPYKVTLSFLRHVSESEPVIIQFYNIVVRQIQKMMNYELLGRHYFDKTQKVDFPTWRLSLWPGFQNSIRQMECNIMMNVESVWKVLQTDSILHIMTNINRQNPNNYQQACKDALIGMIVVTQYNTKAYKISRIEFDSNPRSTFTMKNGQQVTYVDYYHTRYDLSIGDVHQAMLVSEPKERDIRRGQVGDVYLVPELCYPCGLNDTLRSNFKLMKDLAQCLHMPPTERVQTMNKFITTATQNDEITKTLKNWGLKITPQPAEIKARIMSSEEIIMSGGAKIPVDDKADWTMGLRGKQMVSSMSLKNWAIVVTNRDSVNVAQLVSTMQKVGTPLGYRISQPNICKMSDARALPHGVTEAVSQAGGNLDMIMIILPNNNADNYATVKKRCSIDYGIPSQCFLAKNIGSKGLMSIATKVVIQMNAKQGGEPWGVFNQLKSQNLCVLGYDVHHAGPGGGQSIGAMTATVTPTLGTYYSCVSKTPAVRKEVSTCVAKLFQNCMEAYQRKNGTLPAKIMMYRDGVGEGQLFDVHELEIKAFKDRIEDLYGKAGQEFPKLTFIVVNKRISTRFFQMVGRDKYDNPKPGLVVDDVVTRPERFDFFLVSQTARQGCVSPTYYNILLDEISLGPDKLQKFTFKLCHMYFNWSGTVAVPAPCQNAHKLALLVGTALKRPAKASLDYLLHFL